jgi:hypothetical protein
MKRLIAATSVACCLLGLASSPTAVADHCGGDYPDVCHEFDWAQPYFEAFESHGIGYLAGEIGIPLLNEASLLCTGETTRYRLRKIDMHRPGGRRLTYGEVDAVIEATRDVCPVGRVR